MKATKNKKLVIDADVTLYRAAFLAEEEIKWADDVWTIHTNMNEAKANVEDQIYSICKTLNSKDFILAFSDRSTFRHEMWPAYKGNRKTKRKPLGISDLKAWMCDKFPSVIYPRLEADDVCGILCTEDPDNTVAVSIDKDFNTLPITWYNTNDDTLKTITKGEADFFHLVQSLTGDSTDGFDGIKGVGPMTARKLLHKKGNLWKTVVSAYEDKGLTEDDALMTARLARILRHGDYNKETHEVTLWQPKREMQLID